MTETLFLPDSSFCGRMLCYYVNTTSHVQFVQIHSMTNRGFERVVFPGQRLMFEAS